MAEVGLAAETLSSENSEAQVSDETNETVVDAAAPDEAVDTPEEQVEEEAEPQKGSRAQKRIQQLSARAKELEQTIAQRDAQYQQYIQSLQQQHHQQEQQLAQERLEIERRRLETEQQRIRREEEAGLSDLEKWRRSVVNDAKSEVEKAAASRVEQLEKRLQDMESQRKAEIERFEAKQRTDYFQKKAEEEGTRTVLSGLLPEDRNKLVQDTGNLVMVWAAANGVDPSVAAPAFNQFLDRLVAAKIKSTGSSAKKSVKVNPPSALVGGKATPAERAASSSIPSMEDILAAGYSSFFHWVEQGEKPIPRGAAKNARR